MDKKQLQERYAEFQRATLYPAEYVHPDTTDWIKKSMIFHSPASLKMTVSDYVALVNRPADSLTLWDLAVAFHAMEIRTAGEMNMNLTEYCDYMTAVNNMIEAWRKIVEPKWNAMQREFDAKQKIEEKSGRAIEMSPVVAEA